MDRASVGFSVGSMVRHEKGFCGGEVDLWSERKRRVWFTCCLGNKNSLDSFEFLSDVLFIFLVFVLHFKRKTCNRGVQSLPINLLYIQTNKH